MDDYGIDLLEEALGSGASDRSSGQGPTGRPQRLFERNDVTSLAKYIKSDACKKIYLMLGAGVSTSAGIPDFRSPETGLYANLARLSLPYPEAVFDIRFFQRNPRPFYTLAKELYPGKYRPTLTHSFIKLLSEKGLLGLCFTQNIDTLERRAGVPASKIIEAHGSFATQRCIKCKRPFGDTEMKKLVEEESIPRCKTCKGLVKPDIVFFGESLPPSFFGSLGQLNNADLLIVMGTSLTVHPFASLVNMVKGRCPRVLINLDDVGGIGSEMNGMVLLGKCDDIIGDLAKELGWEEELDREWMRTATSLDTHEAAPHGPPEKDQTDGTKLDLEIEKIIERVEGSLSVSEKDKASVEEADVSIQPSGAAREEVKDKESTTSQPKTPQKDAEEGNRSPKQGGRL